MPKKSTLNPQQQIAVQTTAGPLLVLAGAGTGKTHTVIERIAEIVRTGTRPENILAVTFTNKAAAELKQRLRKRLGRGADLKEMFACTFHSLCVRLIRRDAERLGYGPTFTIIDQGEQHSIIRKAARHIHGTAGLRPADALSMISNLKSEGIGPKVFALRATEDFEQTLASIYRRYQEALRLRSAMDFDDLLLRGVELLAEHEEPRQYWQDRFHYICVDEFQDTSAVQLKLVQLLGGARNNVCVVGDDDQSIYSWRGAVPGNILEFEKHFPGAQTIYLEENYRSTNAILKASNAVIAVNEKRHPKTLWSNLGDGQPVRVLENENQEMEAQRISGEIASRIRRDARPSDFAILVRAAVQMRAVEGELQIDKVPYVIIGGQSFFDRKEVRDVLSFLTVAANPKDDGALLRIINTPSRGIGDKTVEALTKWAAQKTRTVSQALDHAAEIPGVIAKGAEACKRFATQIAGWRRTVREGRDLPSLVDRILADTCYEEEVRHLYDDPLQQAARLNSAKEVAQSLHTYFERAPEAGLVEFLQDAMLDGADRGKKKEKDQDAVRLITGHSAKGLEFPVVYIIGAEEGLWPHKNVDEEAGDDISEERRLFYVAMTRAKRELTLSLCRGRVNRNKTTPREPSRFLREIPEELLKREGTIADPTQAQDFIASILANLSNSE